MKNTPWLNSGLLLAAVLLAMAGHSAPPPPAPTAPAAANGTPPPPLFTYVSKDKRDPFAPSLEVIKPVAPGCTTDCDTTKPTRTPEPLEQFALESLKFAGTLFYGGSITAIIEDPSGHPYSVKTGNYMGTHEGQITEIGTGYLIIKEKAPTPSDKNATRTVPLKLHKDEEEK